MKCIDLVGDLEINGSLFTHGTENDNVWESQHETSDWNEQHLLTSLPSSKAVWILSPISLSGILTSSLLSPLSPMRLRKPSSMLTCPISAFNPHSLSSPYQLPLLWNVHVVSGWWQIFEFLASEDVDGDQVNLCVTMLSSLWSWHIDDFTWSIVDDNVTVLS